MDDLLTVRQVSIILKVHPLTIRRYINEGKLKAVKVGGNIRISQAELRAFSEGFTPKSHHNRQSTTTQSAKEFPPNDAFFRLKSRGVSLDEFGK